MNAFWTYFWPPFGAGLVIAIIAGAIAFRRPAKRNGVRAIGGLLAIALAALWHGPLGAANCFTSNVEHTIRMALVYNEIPEVSGHLHHGPLTRRAVLSGPADEFQRSQLLFIIKQVPGVESVSWSADPSGIPLIIEGAAAALLGFTIGLLVAYVRELRKRYNAQWNW